MGIVFLRASWVYNEGGLTKKYCMKTFNQICFGFFAPDAIGVCALPRVLGGENF
jgi:hypothetical protein